MRNIIALAGFISACNSNHSAPAIDPSAFATQESADTREKDDRAPTAAASSVVAGIGSAKPPRDRVIGSGFSIELDGGWQQQPAKAELVALVRTTTSGGKQRFGVSRLSDALPANIYTEAGCAAWKRTVMENSHVSTAVDRVVHGAFGTGCAVATTGGDRIVVVTVIPSATGLPFSALCSGEVRDINEVLEACDLPIASWRNEAKPADSNELSFTPLAETKRISGTGFSVEVPAGWALQSNLEVGTYLLAIRGTKPETVRTLTVFGTSDTYVTKSDEQCRAAGKTIEGFVAARSIPTYDDAACELVTESGDIVSLTTFQPDKNSKMLAVRCAGPRSEAKALIADCHEIAKTIRLD